jgi:hypothetical protein
VIDGASTAATYRRARRSLTGVSVGPADEADRARLARAMEGVATGRERLAEAAFRESPAGYSRAAARIRRAAAALRAAVRAFVAAGYAGLRSPRAPRIPPLHVTRTPVRAPAREAPPVTTRATPPASPNLQPGTSGPKPRADPIDPTEG